MAFREGLTYSTVIVMTVQQTKCDPRHLLFEQDDQIQRCNKNIIYKSAFNKLSQLFMKQIF